MRESLIIVESSRIGDTLWYTNLGQKDHMTDWRGASEADENRVEINWNY